MAKCMITPNILWLVKNFASFSKKSGPIIRWKEWKFHVSFSQYIEDDETNLQLILDCLTSEASKPLYFKIDVCIPNSSDAYDTCLLKTGEYNSTRTEWRIWTDSVRNIYRKLGEIKDVYFSISITPAGNLTEMCRTGESIQETKQMAPCIVSFRENIERLFNNAESSDFTVICGDKSFSVHKAILSTRSQFFAGMFRNDMKETKENEAKIENMEPYILELVLRYLYTGELPPLPMDNLLEIHAAADRFIVEPLKIKSHWLLIDAFTAESKKDSKNVTKCEQSGLDKQSGTAGKEINDDKERRMLKNLFSSKEWRLFSEEFPHKAHEMCKPCFLQKM